VTDPVPVVPTDSIPVASPPKKKAGAR